LQWTVETENPQTLPQRIPRLIEIDREPLPETLTALGGVPLPVRALRS
jgi:hypothetical protein